MGPINWHPTIYLLISLAGAAVPAAVGSYAWRRRGKPGAATLAALMWLFALWGLVYAAEFGTTSAAAVGTFYKVQAVVFLPVAPLWLILVLQYTGREAWLTRSFTALLSVVPLVTLALVLTNEDHGLVWTSERVRRAGSLLVADFTYGVWFWVDFAYAALLVVAGVALLVLMVVNSQSLYGKQSACLLLGVAGPWVAYAAYASGLDSGITSLPGLNPIVVAFAPAGLALMWGFYRHKLLDISPVAHDAVVEGMSDGTLVLDARGRIVDLNLAAGILGCSPGEVVGQSFREMMSTRGKATPMRGNRGSALLKRYEERGQAHEEITLGEGDEARHYDLALSALYDGPGQTYRTPGGPARDHRA